LKERAPRCCGRWVRIQRHDLAWCAQGPSSARVPFPAFIVDYRQKNFRRVKRSAIASARNGSSILKGEAPGARRSTALIRTLARPHDRPRARPKGLKLAMHKYGFDGLIGRHSPRERSNPRQRKRVFSPSGLEGGRGDVRDSKPPEFGDQFKRFRHHPGGGGWGGGVGGGGVGVGGGGGEHLRVIRACIGPEADILGASQARRTFRYPRFTSPIGR